MENAKNVQMKKAFKLLLAIAMIFTVFGSFPLISEPRMGYIICRIIKRMTRSCSNECPDLLETI